MGKLCIGAWTLIYYQAEFPRVPVSTSLATGATLYIKQQYKQEDVLTTQDSEIISREISPNLNSKKHENKLGLS